jgi:membrane protease YdiL (CAAX protease family)
MKQQLTVFTILLLVFALLAFASYVVVPIEQLTGGQPLSPELAAIPPWQLGLINALIALVAYALFGLAGLLFARKLGLPGILRGNAGWRAWVIEPFLIGIPLGLVVIIGDRLSAYIGHWSGFTHPPFPLSIIASATAGIGEEILFRMFVLGLWAFLLNLILRRWKATRVALWIGNVIAALAFAAGHLPTVMIMLHVTTPEALPPIILVEMLVLNGVIGLVCGARYMRDGLVAAAGIHFWADVVWHVIFPLIGG